ncbi:FAD-binding oxidoreductase [Acuticoccus sp. M5D2P5]|uniref:NAD(P)/FAD-dependent oxidoreductase n=1 Tax=Acuticoccus kalidii TaxID=2910977 RepID=UPI001F40941C|nr:FAD-binding oxidoreductase [Acuticoccus kalidii]MCF3933133.1 FAD-binding oxidoreductase [Acuticoccus kalidii]
MKVVVCGAGAIGAASAFYLTRAGVEVVLVERTGVACAASGKAGGFLARDWCDGGPLQSLARRSFDLHATLAKDFANPWGYRRMTTFGGARTRGPTSSLVDWVGPTIGIAQRLGDVETTAQVHPALFTRGLASIAVNEGASLVNGEVTGFLREADGRVRGVVMEEEHIDADAVLVAMGPWSILAAQWIDLPAVYGLKGHSLVFNTHDEIPPEALFLEYRTVDGATVTPEVFPRPDGTTYICGLSGDGPLPVDPADVRADEDAFARLLAVCSDISPAFGESRVIARQTCFRPVTRDGLPLMGAVPSAPGAFVATGHSVWGILNAPASGEAMAALITGAEPAVDLAPFDPARLPPIRIDADNFKPTYARGPSR